MITYADLKRAINAKLKTVTVEGAPVELNSRDVTEGFIRPSFFVQFDNNIRSSDESQIHKSLNVQIYYFPTNRYEYSEEVLDVQEVLESKFDLKLRVLDRYFNIDEVNAMMVDGVLNFSFDLAFYDGREYEGLENILVDEIKNGEEFYKKHPIEKMEVLELKEEE